MQRWFLRSTYVQVHVVKYTHGLRNDFKARDATSIFPKRFRTLLTTPAGHQQAFFLCDTLFFFCKVMVLPKSPTRNINNKMILIKIILDHDTSPRCSPVLRCNHQFADVIRTIPPCIRKLATGHIIFKFS